MAIIRLRNLISGEPLDLTEAAAEEILSHAWFAQWYVVETPENWPPNYMDDITPPPPLLSEWVVNEDGYMING